MLLATRSGSRACASRSARRASCEEGVRLTIPLDYLPSQYRLFETIYESPFYWMMSDKAYANTTAEHRGVFVAQTAAHILRSVFGPENVHENVILKSGARDTAGEIDVLVIYGEFAIVVQAKSKRVTLKARAGDTDALKTDFEGAIEEPYRQALSSIDLIKSGAKCLTQDTEIYCWFWENKPSYDQSVIAADFTLARAVETITEAMVPTHSRHLEMATKTLFNFLDAVAISA
jgi:hypothetical protein